MEFLENNGYVVLKNKISPHEIKFAQDQVHNMVNYGKLRPFIEKI